jgi:P-type Cu+ transporter
MIYSRCPERILEALEACSFPVKVLKSLTLEDPILTVEYEPLPPNATVRHLVYTISNVSPQFSVSLYHPPTIEERSRALQWREQRDYLRRLAFSVVVAIPTFIIGKHISLVPVIFGAGQECC